jgi:Autoinducer binding domain
MYRFMVLAFALLPAGCATIAKGTTQTVADTPGATCTIMMQNGPQLPGVLRRKMDLVSFVECSNQKRSLSALFQLLVDCATEQGFSEVAYGALTHDEPVHLPEHRPPAVAVNFPPEWCDRYFERKYHEIDPVVRRTPTFSGPFFVGSTRRAMPPAGQRAVGLGGRARGRSEAWHQRAAVWAVRARFRYVVCVEVRRCRPSQSNEPSQRAGMAVSHRFCRYRPASEA